ncbi:hypothetical protein Tco_1503599 [Tanacetum coccineum]
MVKNMKNPCQTPRGVLVGPNIGFKPVKQVYGQMSKKNNVNTSGNNKKDVEPTIEVNNSNTSDVLNSVENDVDLVIDEKVALVVDEGKPLAKVDSLGYHDSEDEVASVVNEMTNFLASKKVGYATQGYLDEVEQPMKYEEKGDSVGARRNEYPPKVRRIASDAEKTQSE